MRSAQEIFRPYFCLMGQSSLRALSRFALSGQLLRGAKRCWPAPAPPRPSPMRDVAALCHPNEQRAVVTKVRRPPILRIRHQGIQILDHRIQVEAAEFLGVVERLA